MTCYSPLSAYRAPGGGIAFDSRRGYVDLPVRFACGQCIGCRIDRSQAWSVRMFHESQMHAKSCFLTLTYSEAALPADGSLRLRDWQLFAKRLRERKGSFRFFHCGEYGARTERPHYHACVFGLDFAMDAELVKRTDYGSLYRSRELDEIWSHGGCRVGSLTRESAQYVASYCVSKLTGAAAVVYGDRVPPYATMSRRPGIGSSWFDKFRGDVFPSDSVVVRGRHYKTPRFYDSKLGSGADVDLLEKVKVERRRRVRSRDEDLTPERLAVRAEVCSRRLEFFESVRENL